MTTLLRRPSRKGEHKGGSDAEEKECDNLNASSMQIHNRFRVSSFSSTGSDIASVFDVLLRESQLLDEADHEDGGLDITAVERKQYE